MTFNNLILNQNIKHSTTEDKLDIFHNDLMSFKKYISDSNHDALNQCFSAQFIQQSITFLRQVSKKQYKDLSTLSGFHYQQDIELFSNSIDPVLSSINASAATIVSHNTSVAELKNELKTSLLNSLYIITTDDHGRYSGIVTLNKLFYAPPRLKLKSIQSYAETCHFSLDQEDAVKLLQKSQFDVLPVLTSTGEPLGLLEAKAAIDIVMDEQTEDMERFMGIQQEKNELDYINLSVLGHVKKRIVWILGLAVMGLFSGMIIHSYEDAIAAFTILALYMPMIADTGGNAGSQSATLIVRALALGNINIRDWLKVVWKETRIAIIIGSALAAVSIAKVIFLSRGLELPANQTLSMLAAAIGLALFFQVISSTLIGALLPLLSKRMNLDPAVVASPAITTIVDISGLIIYFFCTTKLLGLV
ncbi:magnesium transporter [Photobacterium sp. DA100]|uniref:magnesium transporter n=1 Tax=Photobacterium sp. DA100 TaxID=3027472 RepID=UPI0024790461|nr:magnesium transporter [Photobacterium sp. DA100]WEM43815.1 magnesium transporter [Photobacterium sp. DA100]